MPGYKGIISDADIDAIVAFLFDKKDQKIEVPQEVQSPSSGTRYANITAYRTWSDPSGNPAMKGPYNTLSALNLISGAYEWQIPVGNDEKLRLEGEPNTGLLARSGPVVTAGGLIFISGAADNKIWAFDKKTGEMVWEKELPAANNANVCSYVVNGKQFIALSVGGTKDNPSGSVMTFALPN